MSSEDTNSLDVSRANGRTIPALSQAPRPSLKNNPLPLEWILRRYTDREQGKLPSLSDRIQARLLQREARERNVWDKEEYRQAFITVALAASGHAQPFAEAARRCYACHPDQLFARVTELRKAKLGSEYSDWYDANGCRIIEPIDLAEKSARPPARLGTIKSHAAVLGDRPDVLSTNDIPQQKEPLAVSREGNAPQKTCAYGAEPDQLTGTSRSTETKREARRADTSELGPDALPAEQVPATAGFSSPKKPQHSVDIDGKTRIA